MLFAKAALHVQASPRRFLTTLLFFRTLGTPLPGLGAGPLLLTLVLTVVLMPVLVGATRRTSMPPWTIPVGLVVVALVYRVICTASGHTDLFGPLSWLPNHLDLVGVGLAVALVDASMTDSDARRRLRIGGIARRGRRVRRCRVRARATEVAVDRGAGRHPRLRLRRVDRVGGRAVADGR